MLYKRLIINGVEFPVAVNQAGQGAPLDTTEGAPGVLYMDTDTEKFYKCTAADDGVYTWKEFETGGKVPAVTADDNGKILQVVDGAWAVVEAELGGSECKLPEVTEADNDKLLQCVNGVWTAVDATEYVTGIVNSVIEEALGGDY